MLQCNAKGCTTNNYPLRIEEAELETTEAEYNPDFLNRMLIRINWPALVATAFALGVDQLPQQRPQEFDDDMLKRIHHIILETSVKNGRMICPNCNHVFQIRDSIPNMLLQENEV